MRRSVLFACGALLAAGACAKKLPPPEVAEEPVQALPPPAPAAPPLYQRMGGAEAVAGVVDSFVSNALADKRVNKYFAKTPPARLEYFKALLVAQFCELAGGDCRYTGKSMKDAHTGMNLGDAQFDAMVQDLSLALQEKQVPADAQKEFMDKIQAMHDDIVGAPRGSRP